MPEPSNKKLLGVSVFPGVASGIRSALILVEGKWYRLKGCGNNDEGFILKTLGLYVYNNINFNMI